jgi:GTP-binding protein Era
MLEGVFRVYTTRWSWEECVRMGLITSLKDSIAKLFIGGEPKRIGIYGPPNAGKCLAANEQILLSNGTHWRIEDIFEYARETCPNASDVSDTFHETWLECSEAGIQIPALTSDLTVESTTVSHVFRQRYRGSMYRVRTGLEGEVIVSPDHPFVTITENGVGQTKADDISTGSSVALLSSSTPTIPNHSTSNSTDDEPVDGHLRTDSDTENLTVDLKTNLISDGGMSMTSNPTSMNRENARNSLGVRWDEVVSVEEVEYDGYIYDLTVPEHHTFATADGIVVHNTTLANRIARDWTGDAVGPESHVPHETRRARRKENVEIQRNGSTVTIDIVDTPGVTTKVDYKEFLEHDMTKEDAVRRSREATEGVAEAMHWLREDVDGVVYVLDSTEDPFTQVNTMLVGIIESRNLPVLIFANKIDLDESSTQRIVNAFPQHEVVPLSALEGDNMQDVYDKIANHFE